ncbi:hypothetical protein [Pseudoalteromonas distincta]|jgi:hypothetical protein|uniref:hypothetical protein n=1 Tax=Pseudoalteromonas distincta TaxID=77608 RepID=UPI001869D91A|nr:hypothetical protein [Pseudoalteromonas distincta]MBE3675043.1 hypothetical protein [Pseudoalteromonas distincta KMM 3548]
MKNNDACDIAINPSTGLPITNASANIVDVGGNVVGINTSNQTIIEIDESFGSNSFDSFSAFDDSF